MEALKNRWVFSPLIFSRHFTSPPHHLHPNYSNKGLVSADCRLMAATLFEGTNDSAGYSAGDSCWQRSGFVTATVKTRRPDIRAGMANFIRSVPTHKTIIIVRFHQKKTSKPSPSWAIYMFSLPSLQFHSTDLQEKGFLLSFK